MKKIGIITHYDVHNHGALLQLNALVQILKKNNCRAKALQFEKNYDFLGVDLKHKYNLSLKSVPIYIKYLLKNGVSRTWFNYKKRNILGLFKRDQGLIGKYYSEYKNLDTIIIGSDEVFALHTGPTPAFWGYGLPSNNIISYAGSFGPTTKEEIVERKCVSFVKGGLNSLNKISVRDNNSLDIAKELVGEKEVIKVCDPVLLYGYTDEIISLPPIKEKPFILIYSYDANMNDIYEIEKVKLFAKENDLITISPGFYHKWCDKNINVDPITLLSYFRDAQFVITDTFHGSVMSIVNKKRLAVKIRGNSNKLYNLLLEYSLENQIINADFSNLMDLYLKKINWDNVEKEILNRRKSSMDYLLNNI